MGASNSTYDIVIAGGGMVGSSLALALRPLGLSIAVVEAVDREGGQQPSFDDRSTALSRSSQKFFEALGLWPDIEPSATPIRKIHVSDRGRFGFSHLDAEEQGVEALGYVVINRVLGEVLQRALGAAKNIDVLCPARITDVQATEEAATITVAMGKDDDRITRARLLVAADGARSQVRAMVGLGATHKPYEQSAVIGNLQPDKPHQNVAYERFTEAGPIALLPVANGRAAFVWTLSPNEAERVLALGDDEFTAELQAAFGYRLGRFSRVGNRASYPLSLTRAEGLVARRSVVIGNAAHGLHPVAGQGFNLGLRDVAALADCLADSQAQQGSDFDPGDMNLLEDYARWRRADQEKLVDFTDNLIRLFGSDVRPVKALRNLGMWGFDLVPGVRGLFAKHTMGLAGRLPRLSRGLPLK
jgi:2-octaprenyl-6-methoxyphenol hydroxylase